MIVTRLELVDFLIEAITLSLVGGLVGDAMGTPSEGKQ